MMSVSTLYNNPDTSTEVVQKNRTLYIKNLNSKVKLDVLKKELQGIFENFGNVVQIVAMSSFWRRGQAWIVFADQDSADSALNQLQGFPYSGKKMVIQYAREKSDIVAKEDGTYKARPPGPRKPRAILEREKKLQQQLQQFQQIMVQHLQTQNGSLPNKDGDKSQNNLPLNLIPPQLAAMMMPQLPPQNSQGILGSDQTAASKGPLIEPIPLQYNNYGQQILQNHIMSKDAVVAAATATAAQAVEAAKKRGENVSRFDSQIYQNESHDYNANQGLFSNTTNEFQTPVNSNFQTPQLGNNFKQGISPNFQEGPPVNAFQKASPLPPPGYKNGLTPMGFVNGPPLSKFQPGPPGFQNNHPTPIGYQTAPPSGFQAAPPSGFQAAPPSGFQAAPPSGFQAAPPSGFQAAPPSGFQAAPPSGFQAAPPSGFQAAPPGGFQPAPPSGFQAAPPGYQMHNLNLPSITRNQQAPFSKTFAKGFAPTNTSNLYYSNNPSQYFPASPASNPISKSVTQTNLGQTNFNTSYSPKFSNNNVPAVPPFSASNNFSNNFQVPTGFSGGKFSENSSFRDDTKKSENDFPPVSSEDSNVKASRTLFVEHLPAECDEGMLNMVFKQYPGCGEIRQIVHHRVAFVDYETVAQATTAIRYLNNFPIQEGCRIRVSYAQM